MTPDPFTPADCDLRGLQYMPIFGDRLFGSATWIAASPEARCAALRLWWRSYAHEVPAGSLPDDDKLLADYAGYGVALKSWSKIRDQAMRGWVKCSDGRLYHKTVCEVALESWQTRVRNREKVEKFRQRNRSVTVTGGGTEPLRNRRAGLGWAGNGSVTTTSCVSNSAQGATHTARLIDIEWKPSEAAVAELRIGRPDLVGAYFDKRMEDFRLWCRSRAIMSHDAEATWLGFMRQSHAQKISREDEIEAAIAASRRPLS